MRKNIKFVDHAAIYEQEFERVKDAFEEEKKDLNFEIY